MRLMPGSQKDNGNHELRTYNSNYPFNLSDTLAKYPIKELSNEQYKSNLIDSLHRGNLQKVTFVAGDGKEEKLFISPSITLGALNIYDTNKQRMTTEMLLEKQLIGKDVVASLNAKLSSGQDETHKTQVHTQTQKHIPEKKDQKTVQKPSRQKVKK
ncbi:MAG: hypothetical protein QM802_03285 [Agriterribacter sp.]